jgi:hypothetical protein
MLGVLAETSAELNLRTISQLAGVSQAQASRVLPDLVELGVVERREVPPSSLFRLVPEHVASRAILQLAHPVDTVLDEVGRLAAALPIPPVSVVVFGSLARREAGADSDIDVVVVRPQEVDEDDEPWAAGVEKLAHRSPPPHRQPGRGARGQRPRGRLPPVRPQPLWSDIRRIAAASLAIHAGINSADAVCGARLGRRAAGEDHDQVLALLRQAGPDGGEVERDLRRLLPSEPRPNTSLTTSPSASPPRPSSGPDAVPTSPDGWRPPSGSKPLGSYSNNSAPGRMS